MKNRSSKSDFLALLFFLTTAVLVLTNGFTARVGAQDDSVDVYTKLEPVGDVLDRILEEYYEVPDVDHVVEGALQGMMNALDEHSSFISAEDLETLTEDTEGEFEGIGVSIRLEDDGSIVIFQPLPGSPADDAGVQAFDRLLKIDETPTDGMNLSDAAKLIRGRRGTTVHLTLLRGYENKEKEPEIVELDVRRDKIPLESVKEARLLEGGIGYIRISDFKKHTSNEMAERITPLLEQGMTSLILDLRWNSGGLLSASKDVSELFLPKNTLVTYTKGRERKGGFSPENMKLYTEKPPVLPEGFPMLVLINGQTASSAEIVTGALQFWQRALILGEKTYGKGSVQTIIPLKRPEGSALRLTTALYYTPAEVTIHKAGIKPDIDVPMDLEQQTALWKQMYASYETDPSKVNAQDHGAVTGNETVEGQTQVQDLQLQRA
ncbi:MAG: family peptidase, partial [Candidatus Hydrogenedentes bacterium]|nr:family peptidase [Candidatus Hydrogenedentota bacterium]